MRFLFTAFGLVMLGILFVTHGGMILTYAIVLLMLLVGVK